MPTPFNKSLPIKESTIQRQIINLLKFYTDLVPVLFRINAGAIQTKQDRYIKLAPKGVSDIVGMLKDGTFLAIEVKTPKRRNRVTPEQADFIDNVNNNGGLGFVCTDPEEALETIKERFKE